MNDRILTHHDVTVLVNVHCAYKVENDIVDLSIDAIGPTLLSNIVDTLIPITESVPAMLTVAIKNETT